MLKVYVFFLVHQAYFISLPFFCFLSCCLLSCKIFSEGLTKNSKDGVIETKEKTIAYINLEYVLQNSVLNKTAKRRTTEQSKAFAKLRKKVETSLHTYRKKMRQLEALLGHSEYMKEFKELQKKLEGYQKELQEVKKEYKLTKEKYQAELFQELLAAVQLISEKEKIKIVFSKDIAVIFSDDSFDISDKVIDLLDDLNQRDTITVK